MLFKRKRNDDEKISLANYTITSILGEDAVIEGTIITKTSVRIDGTLIGGVVCDGVVILSKGGRIKGNVIAESIIVAGTVEGNMKIREKVNVEPTGAIYGDITTKKLLIDEESVFQGQCFMNREKNFESAEDKIKRVKEEDISFGVPQSEKEKKAKGDEDKKTDSLEKNREDNKKENDKAEKNVEDKSKEEKINKEEKNIEKKSLKIEEKINEKIEESNMGEKSAKKLPEEKKVLEGKTEENKADEKREEQKADKTIEKAAIKAEATTAKQDIEKISNHEINAAEQAVREMNKKALKALLDSGDSDMDFFEIADKNKKKQN